ncbi:class I SAM-dependent methyltransferase [Thermomonas fusca]|uniref:Class I SAM-dependent methyltransferase n=1 Tax=Thermomonas fusca TaxID=215690 RepID=A0A5R9PCG0_9GAMM|nr:class I SAM-dependent methyltransferase [Thermomonas fusca]TLX20896.1 class I SAM-dependent methyltransferase [Thermomonas fusca]
MIVSKPHVYEHANPLFVRAVSRHSKVPVILDVGCWNGTLGRELIRSCGAVVDGIERDAMQAEQALGTGYRRVEIVDLNEPLDDSACQEYDFILFGDILEHLLQPKDVLAAISRRGKPEARILVSLPNIAFIANRLSHLLGNWDYKDYGILDRTHLRFFTKRTMVALLEGAGLRVVRVDGYVGLHRYPWFIREPLRMLGRTWPSLFAIQIVLEAELMSA